MEMIECNIFQERLHDLSGEVQERGMKKEGKYVCCKLFIFCVACTRQFYVQERGGKEEGRKTHMCAELVELQVDFGKRKLI